MMQLAQEAGFSLGALKVRPATSEVLSARLCEVLSPRVMKVLVKLARAEGQTVARDDLVAAGFEGKPVDDETIAAVIDKLNELAERSGGGFVVETLADGYRLATPERTAEGGSPIVRARPRVVVLEFTHQPGDDDQAWFAEALADELTAGLTKSPLLAVTPRQALLLSDVAGRPPGAICERLGVDYVLDGKVRSLGGTARVSVQLIQGADETSAWSAHYDRPVADLFTVLNEITASIIGTVEPAVLEWEEARAVETPERSLEFWRLFVQGRRRFWRSTPDEVRAAEGYLLQALAIEPEDVSALSILAHCKLFPVWVGIAEDPGEAIGEAHKIAMQAVTASSTDAFAQYTLGVVLSLMGRQPEAKASQRRALELNPYLAAAAGEMGRLLAFEGYSDDAVAYCDRAISASPNDPHTWLWHRSKAIARFVVGDYERAARDAADACAHGPQRFPLHYLLAACYAAAGDQDSAERALADGERLARERARRGRLEGPAYALAALKTGHPFARPADLDRFVKALQKSGWQSA